MTTVDAVELTVEGEGEKQLKMGGEEWVADHILGTQPVLDRAFPSLVEVGSSSSPVPFLLLSQF